MKHIIYILILLTAFTGVASEKVPLEHFAEKSKFNSFRISPDGKHLAFTYDADNQENLAVMNLKSKKITTTFSSDGNGREIATYLWASNKRIVMLNQKITGWLDGQYKHPKLVAGNIDGSRRIELLDFSVSRSGVRIVSPLHDDSKNILVAKSHFTDKGGVKLHKMNVFNGDFSYVKDSPKTHGTSKSRIRSIAVDTNNEARAAFEFDPVDLDNDEDNVSYLHYKDKDGWELLKLPKNRDTLPRVSILGFNKSNTKFYFASNHDLEHEGVVGLFELDFKTKEIKKLYRNPDVDIAGGVYGPKGELIAVGTQAGYTDYYYIDSEENMQEVNFHKSLRVSFKNEDVSVSSYTKNGKMATLRVASDKNPGEYYIFDREKNSVSYIGSSMPSIKAKQMASVEPFVFTARDGLKMFGLMTIPNNKKLKDLPLVIYPHGGPYGVRDGWRWDRRAQMLANNGYLVIQLDFRGSGGYGEDFRKKGKGEWGAKMQDDLTDVTKWAIKEGYADKNRVCIHGVSYGGYASMQAVVKEPDLYKCSIPDAGPYELRLQWDEADSFRYDRAAGERYLKWMLGENTPLRIRERSPAYHVDKVKAALFIVHGSEDVRVPIENAYFLEEKLKEAGKPYIKMYKKDGHGFQKLEFRVELYEKMLEFLNKHIGK